MILSPSLLASDFGRLADELAALERAGLAWAHWDVMDGHFVPNITWGPPVIKALRGKSRLFFDVHLMIERPERYLKAFAEAGADLLVVHAEALTHPLRVLDEIKGLGPRCGLALNPGTPLNCLDYLLPELDLVLLMSVNPGFGGQKFMPLVYDKITRLRRQIDERAPDVQIQVDGGVAPSNAGPLVAAGADVLVAGSAFFQFPPYEARLKTFQEAAATRA